MEKYGELMGSFQVFMDFNKTVLQKCDGGVNCVCVYTACECILCLYDCVWVFV